MIGSLIGLGVRAAGTIYGEISASGAIKGVKKDLEKQKKDNDSWFNREYNADATQRADAQRILKITEDRIRHRNREAAGVQAVMGGTDASVAATKEANAQAQAEAASRIAVAGEARKDAVEERHRLRDAEIQDKLNNMEVAKANAIAQAVKGGVAPASAGIADALDEEIQEKRNKKEAAKDNDNAGAGIADAL